MALPRGSAISGAAHDEDPRGRVRRVLDRLRGPRDVERTRHEVDRELRLDAAFDGRVGGIAEGREIVRADNADGEERLAVVERAPELEQRARHARAGVLR